MTSVYTKENLENIPTLSPKLDNLPSVTVNFKPEIVEKKLKQLKTTRSIGPDGFHSRILTELAQSVKLHLSIIFQKEN